MDKLESFLSKTGADYYGLDYNLESITLIKEPMIVPESIHGVTPYLAGETISWSIKS